MEKTNVRVNTNLCAECLTCRLICSFRYHGVFNPTKARIVIKPGEIRFTDDCVKGCHLCVNYCAYGALVRQ